MNDAIWKQRLSPLQYQVTRHAATERPFSGEFNNHWQAGTYQCICCSENLFSSAHKFDAGCGWPSFDQPSDQAPIEQVRDSSHGMVRTEVRCATCQAHLGHVFEDGPTATGLRYCINSASLAFAPVSQPEK